MKLRTSSLTLAVLLAASPALAQAPRPQPKAPAKPGPAKPGPAPGPIGPADVSDAIEDEALEGFVSEKEALLSAKRQNMMRSLNDILARNPYYAGKAGVLFRLAELEWEEARYLYFQSRKKWDKEYEAFLDGTVKVQPPEPKPDYTDALKHYKQILQEFPDYERLDEVMYFLGKGLVAAEKSKEGASYFSRLIKQFPGSRFLPDAYFQVAEYYFNNDLLFAARTNYQEVLKYKDSPLFQFALYKLAWVYYNLKEWRLAIDTMKSVIEGLGMSTAEQKKIQFRNQAMNDLVLSFAEVPDGWKEMRDYFERIGGEKLARDKLRKIAQKYVADDKNEESIQVWRYFLEKYANEATAVAWYQSIVDGVRRLEDQKRLEAVMRETVVFFDPKGTWAVINRNNVPVFKQALVLAEDSLDFVATWYHQQAQKKDDRALYVQAAKDYEEFLTRFPGSGKAYKVQFFLAEIYYFELHDWEKAAESYLKVVYRDTEKGKYIEDAAYGSVLAARNIMDPESASKTVQQVKEKKRKGRKRRRGPDIKAKGEVRMCEEGVVLKPTPLNKDEERFIVACESFRKWLPKSNHTPEVMFYSASVLQKHDLFEKAIPQLETIVNYHAHHKYAAHAANSLFCTNAQLSRWPDVERWARFLIEKKNFKVRKKSDLQQVIAIAMHKQSEDLQKTGEFKKAASKMVALAREFPKHELAPKALFNAAAIHERGKRTDRALELYEDVLRAYPEDEVAPQALYVIGLIHEARTDFVEAAKRFEAMEKYKDYGVSADAIYNAGAIREALMDYDGALAIFAKYRKMYPGRDDVHQVFFHEAEVYEKKGDKLAAKDRYAKYIKKYPKQAKNCLDAQLRYGKLLGETGGRVGEVAIHLVRTLNRWKRLPKGARDAKAKSIAAEAKFLQGEHSFASFNKLGLPDVSRVGRFRKAMIEKGKGLTRASQIYFAVFEFKSHGWTVAAATRIGQLYHRFSDALYQVPLPPGLSEDEAEMYRFLLDEKAFPLQEKAIEAYQRAVTLAQTNQVYNDWAAKAVAELAKLSPETFPLAGDRSVAPIFVGDMVSGGVFVAQATAPPPPVPVYQPGMIPGLPPGTAPPPGTPVFPGTAPMQPGVPPAVAPPAPQPAPPPAQPPPAGAGAGVAACEGR